MDLAFLFFVYKTSLLKSSDDLRQHEPECRKRGRLRAARSFGVRGCSAHRSFIVFRFFFLCRKQREHFHIPF